MGRDEYKRKVLRKLPTAFLEENSLGPNHVRWYVWWDKFSKSFTQDLLGSGKTQNEAWKDAADKLGLK